MIGCVSRSKADRDTGSTSLQLKFIKENTMNTQNTAAIGQHADTMTKEQMEARISLLSDEIDANEEENRAMNDEIESLYKRIDALK